ncbi:MOSC domain-containing protein [Streptacidiphilus sp. NEAU-YB345]|uniref:MOSC domain-containing protein n=1 Tax=Streptacidiphilus fuscans TaxID=2789292 RepID=A0A931B0E3_9ACTN|nr:MOSC domain-containing protein [Streptacidiphilus fuscans]
MFATVAQLRRHPVKSLLGETVRQARLSPSGLEGDRRLALLDRESGKVVSAKHPRLWRAALTLAASTAADGVLVGFPDGSHLPSTARELNDRLSTVLGRAVTLTDAPPADASLDRARPDEVLTGGVDADVAVDLSRLGAGLPPGAPRTFVDFAPLHLITTATLDRIAALSPRGTVEAARYRPNLVLRTLPAALSMSDGAPGGFVENDWLGRDLRIGDRPDSPLLRVIARTPRCAVPTLAHGDLPRDTSALRVLAAHNRVVPLDAMGPEPCAGVYAQVVRPGQVRVGDAVRFAT